MLTVVRRYVDATERVPVGYARGMTGTRVPRRYDSSRRQEQARRTRRRILDAAAELFVSQGYAGTTIAETATAAGVAPQTVYAVFGTKRAILKELVDVRIAGDDEPVAVMDRPFVQRIEDEPDGRRKLEIFAAHLREVHERTVDVLVALRAAADSDPEVAELWKTLTDQRLFGQTPLRPAPVRHRCAARRPRRTGGRGRHLDPDGPRALPLPGPRPRLVRRHLAALVRRPPRPHAAPHLTPPTLRGKGLTCAQIRRSVTLMN